MKIKSISPSKNENQKKEKKMNKNALHFNCVEKWRESFKSKNEATTVLPIHRWNNEDSPNWEWMVSTEPCCYWQVTVVHCYVLCFYSEEELAFLAGPDSVEMLSIHLSDSVHLPKIINQSINQYVERRHVQVSLNSIDGEMYVRGGLSRYCVSECCACPQWGSAKRFSLQLVPILVVLTRTGTSRKCTKIFRPNCSLFSNKESWLYIFFNFTEKQ